MIIDNQFQLYVVEIPLGQLARRHFPTLNKPYAGRRAFCVELPIYCFVCTINFISTRSWDISSAR